MVSRGWPEVLFDRSISLVEEEGLSEAVDVGGGDFC